MTTRTRRPAATLLCVASAVLINGFLVTSQLPADDATGTESVLTLDEWLKQKPTDTEATSPIDEPPAADLKPVETAVYEKSEPVESAITPVEFETPASAPAPVEARNDSATVTSAVARLIDAARTMLAAGDVRQAHLLAEAAAEMPIQFRVFQQQPVRVLDEIEYVLILQHRVVATAYVQPEPAAPARPAPAAQPVPYTEIQPNGDATADADDARAYRAIGPMSLSVRPLQIDADGNRQELPERRAGQALGRYGEVAHTMGFSRDWTALSYAWDAPVLKHQPLYFEDVELERYGNEYALIQPFVSAGRFYGTFATLPYQMSLPDNAWFHCVYDLGHNRPGNCSPYSIHTLPIDPTAGFSAGGVITGIVFALMTP